MKYLQLLFLLLSSLIFAQKNIGELNFENSIPKDTAVVRGQLNNGLKYYILKNDRPKKTVEMRLMIKAGSLQEEADQLGLAHILEHLLFNGTKNFPKHKIIEYLESIGLKFGADLNAHTGFDETVYKLSIPTEDIEKVDTAFQILEDWSHNALLEDEEIEAERGVVMEEYRLRLKGLTERIWNGAFDAFYKDTRERNRLPIGTEESILNFEPQRLRDFYTTWYRPNLMSIAIVGDIDEAYAEEKIKKHFSKLVNPENETKLEEYTNNLFHAEKKVKIITDPELTSTGIQIGFLDKEKQEVDGALIKELKSAVIDDILMQMLNNRFQELSFKKDPPFLGAGAYRSGTLVTNLNSLSVGAGIAEGKVIRGIKSLYTELERAYRFGFTATELANAKKNVLSDNETVINQKNERYSKALITTLLSEYKENWALTSVDWEYEFKKNIVPSVNLEAIQNQLKQYYRRENQNILILVPKKEGVVVPKKQEVLQAITEVENNTTIKAYESKLLRDSLLETLPTKGSITSNESLAYDISKIVLSNGVEVFYKKTDFDTDYIGFKAFSYGGTSLFSDKEAKGVANLLSYASSTGIGGFKTYELQKVLSGKQVSLNSYVAAYDEGFVGNSKVTDMETLFQLIHLNFLSVNKDEETYNTVLSRSKEWLKNQLLNPKRVFQNRISNVYNEGNPRYINVFEDNNFEKIADGVPYEKVYSSYVDRFANAGDFKFFFIGDFEEEKLKDFAELYLGSLPSITQREMFKLHEFDKKLSTNTLTVYKGIAEKAQVQINFSHKAAYNPKESKAIAIFSTILERKLRNAIREEKAGTYGVQVSFGHNKRPIERYEGSIRFECDPKNVEDLKIEVKKVLQAFLKAGPSEEEVESVKEQWVLARKKQLRQNGFWLTQMHNRVYWKKPMETLFENDKLDKSITAEYVKKTASKLIDEPEMVATLLPEKK